MTPYIEPLPSAPDGQVTTLPFYSKSDFLPTHAIICRCTAPLISFAFNLLRRSIPCNILGRDFGAGLKAFVEKFKAQTIPELRDRVISHRGTEVERLIRKGKRHQAELLDEKCECVLLFAANAITIPDVLRKIDDLFTPAPSERLTLATIHRSKGLEWDKVFILDPQLLPSRWAEADWELKQERNLHYVAVTRARLELVYIESGHWK